MKPTNFPESNGTLSGGPAADYGTEDDVVDLPVHRDGQQIISCWRLSWRERFRLLVTGRVWLLVLTGRTHAPVCLAVEPPFQQAQADAEERR
jgi:hypothetical protein